MLSPILLLPIMLIALLALAGFYQRGMHPR
ncbi:hypothetical protein SAMN06265337_0339 [Hymenobacter gelipurpurascens]|uniref:Uncharacterized protein n=1 Tax=Hymenobacter gelipurpurascens TaxID=89968 RepID=A0A212T4N6_9BACT|nr:hypothetical protein SAMN06265337_0339 [Hymenobacter gelipurpurascens]